MRDRGWSIARLRMLDGRHLVFSQPGFTRPCCFFQHPFHFRLIVGLPLIEWKHAIYQPHAAKALISAVVVA
jgi:hypothetical protein